MPGAVRGLALHAVLPALQRAVHDGGGLAVVQLQRAALGREDLPQVAAVGHLDHVPVVQVEQLRRRPLHVVAGQVAVAADAFAVDGGLVPVQVQHDVAERAGPGRGQCLRHTAGREPALALHDVHAGRVGAVAVARPEGEADGAGNAHAGGAGGQLDERRRRRRVAVQRLGVEPPEEGCGGDGVPAEAEQVLQPQPAAVVGRQELRSAHARDLVAERPDGVQAHGLVAGGVADDVGVRAVGVVQAVVGGVEEDGLDEAAGRDGASGVAGGGHVVEEDPAEGAIQEVERLELGDLRVVQRRLRRREVGVDGKVDGAPGAEGHRHGTHSFHEVCGVMLRAGPPLRARRRLVYRLALARCRAASWRNVPVSAAPSPERSGRAAGRRARQASALPAARTRGCMPGERRERGGGALRARPRSWAERSNRRPDPAGPSASRRLRRRAAR